VKPMYKKIILGMSSVVDDELFVDAGLCGGIVGSPFDVVNVR